MDNFILTKNEDLVFRYVLVNGSTTALECSKKLLISKAGVYKIFLKLVGYGLIKKNASVFTVKSLKGFYEDILEKERQIYRSKEMLEEYFKLEQRYKNQVEIFSGKGAYSKLNNALRKESVENGYIIFNSDFIPKSLDSRRSKSKYTKDNVINFTNKTNIPKSKRKELFLKYAMQEKFVAISIFNSKIAFYTSERNEEKGIIIEDSNIARILKDLMDYIN